MDNVLGQERASRHTVLLSNLLNLAVTEGVSFKRHGRIQQFIKETVPAVVGVAEEFGERAVLKVLSATAKHAACSTGFMKFCEHDLRMLLQTAAADSALLDDACGVLERAALRVMRRAESGCFERQATWTAGDFYFNYVARRAVDALVSGSVETAEAAADAAVDRILTPDGARGAAKEALALRGARAGTRLPAQTSEFESAMRLLNIRPEWLTHAGLSKKQRGDYLFLYEVLREAERAGLPVDRPASREKFCLHCLKQLCRAKDQLGHGAVIELLSAYNELRGGYRALANYCRRVLPGLLKRVSEAAFVDAEERSEHAAELAESYRSLAAVGCRADESPWLFDAVQANLLIYGKARVDGAMERAAASSSKLLGWQFAREFGGQLAALAEGNEAARELLEHDGLRASLYRAGLSRKHLQTLAFSAGSGLRQVSQLLGVPFAVSVMDEALNAGLYGTTFARVTDEALISLSARAGGIERDNLQGLINQILRPALPAAQSVTERCAARCFTRLYADALPALAALPPEGFARRALEAYVTSSHGRLQNVLGEEAAAACVTDLCVDLIPAVGDLSCDSEPLTLAGVFETLAGEAGAEGFSAVTRCLRALVENGAVSTTAGIENMVNAVFVPLYCSAPDDTRPELTAFLALGADAGLLQSAAHLGSFAVSAAAALQSPGCLRGVLIPAIQERCVRDAHECGEWSRVAARLAAADESFAPLLLLFGTPALFSAGIVRSPGDLERAGGELVQSGIREAAFWESFSRISAGVTLPTPQECERLPVVLRPALFKLLGSQAARLNLEWRRIGKGRDALRRFVDFLDPPGPHAAEILLRLSGRRGSVVPSVLDYDVRLNRAGRPFYYQFADAEGFNRRQRAVYVEYATRLCKSTMLSRGARDAIERVETPGMRRLLEIAAGLSVTLGRGEAQNALAALVSDYVQQRCRETRYTGTVADDQLSHLTSSQRSEWSVNRVRPRVLPAAAGLSERLRPAYDALRGDLPELYERHAYTYTPKAPFDCYLRTGERPARGDKRALLHAAALIEGPLRSLVEEGRLTPKTADALRETRRLLRRLTLRPALDRLSELEQLARGGREAGDRLVYVVETDSVPELLDTQRPQNNCLMWQRVTPGTKAIPSFGADAFMKKVMVLGSQPYGALSESHAPATLERLARRTVGDERLAVADLRTSSDGDRWRFRLKGDLTVGDAAAEWSAVVLAEEGRLVLRAGDEFSPRGVFHIGPGGQVYGPSDKVLVWQNLAVLPTDHGPFIFPDSYDPRTPRAAALLSEFTARKAESARIPLYQGGFVLKTQLPPSRAPFVFHQRLFHGAVPADDRGPHLVGYGVGEM